MSDIRTVKLIDRTTGYGFDAYVREGEEVDFSIFTNDVDFADAPEIRNEIEGTVVLEPGATLTPAILARLATVPAPSANRVLSSRQTERSRMKCGAASRITAGSSLMGAVTRIDGRNIAKMLLLHGRCRPTR
jgi:hypothetical protein